MDLFIGIDGTHHSHNDQTALADYKNSHVSKVINSHKRDGWFVHYMRGPTVSGVQTQSISLQASRFIYDFVVTKKLVQRVFLTGWSRGGAACVGVARNLHETVEIEGMFLFDAVDMTLGADFDIVPSNVKKTYHAIREAETRSRDDWGNAATKPQNSISTFVIEEFFASHAAMGGIETKNNILGVVKEPGNLDMTRISADADNANRERVRAWMNINIASATAKKVRHDPHGGSYFV